MKTYIAVVVAHRLTTIKNIDIIYVFDTGEIKEVGIYESLVAKNGVYYNLVFRSLNL
jgi:ABC-type multidrug transport system fused ATPase/permease subunit